MNGMLHIPVMEVWRTINDAPNYDISNFGNIRNNKTGKVLKQCVKAGYCNISLVNKTIKKTYKVHRLQMTKIKEYKSIVMASKELNIGKSNIRGVLINYRKSAGGFIFKYLEEI